MKVDLGSLPSWLALGAVVVGYAKYRVDSADRRRELALERVALIDSTRIDVIGAPASRRLRATNQSRVALYQVSVILRRRGVEPDADPITIDFRRLAPGEARSRRCRPLDDLGGDDLDEIFSWTLHAFSSDGIELHASSDRLPTADRTPFAASSRWRLPSIRRRAHPTGRSPSAPEALRRPSA